MSRIIHYRELNGYKYALAVTYSVELPELAGVELDHRMFSLKDGVLTVQPNYCWDGPSGPTFDSPCAMRGSLVHDVLYQAMRLGLMPRDRRLAADDILYRLCREDGMGLVRAALWFRSLRIAGAANVEPREEKIETIRTAPTPPEDPTTPTHIKQHFHKLRR
jgi:hypothetical protein